jgi:hypothetical protein
MQCLSCRIIRRSGLFIAMIHGVSLAQNSNEIPQNYADSTTNYVKISGYASSIDRTPFWLQTNQFGTAPSTGNAGRVGTGLEHYWRLGSGEQKPLRIGGGVEIVGLAAGKSRLLLPQAHFTVRYRNWEFFAGRKKQWVGLADSLLSSGSYSWSTNAMPIPKIQFGTAKFVAVPFTKGWISFQAFYSDGWFDSNRPVTSNLKLHQKSLYARIGKVNSRFKLYGGFNHQVQWGGKSAYNTVDGQMPNDFQNYINVVTGRAHSNNPSHHDATGRVGNHLGSIDLAAEIETYSMSIFVYRQNIYEDGSLFWLSNIADGLNGIRFKRKNGYGSNFEVNTVVLEFLHTKSQGGSVADDRNPSYMRGKDDYFNNGQVRDGWSYLGRGVGTPFIPPTSETIWNWPNYADFFTSNNRVSVYHLGMSGTLFQKINWAGKFSYSSNSGAYDNPFEGNPKQFSGFISLQTPINIIGGVSGKLAFAADKGHLYPVGYGVSIGLQKSFGFR